MYLEGGEVNKWNREEIINKVRGKLEKYGVVEDKGR